MYKYLLYLFMVIIWLYLSICLCLIGGDGIEFYAQNSMIMKDKNGKCYQLYYFIPLCLFTNYFNKNIYIDDPSYDFSSLNNKI